MADANVEAGKAQVKPAPPAASPAPVFTVPADSEGKARSFKPWTFTPPHHATFHLVWMAFCACQFATFSAAALGPIIRDDLNATDSIMSGAGIAAVSGSMVSRLLMGYLCDLVGPRQALAGFILLLAPAVFCMSLVTSGAELVVVRFFIGLSLGGFVTTQYCSSSMFNVRIVGFTNSCAAGWGNMGGGLAQLFMPLIYLAIKRNVVGFEAWRWAFFIPGGIMVLMAVLFYMIAKDSPSGNFRELRAAGMKTGKYGATAAPPAPRYGLLNYRTWCLASIYAFSFGVELTVNNIIVGYIAGQFNKDLITAGGVGSLFGLMNLFSRSSGGLASDMMARVFGMRGRLWLLFGTQVAAGAFCVGLGLLSENFQGSIACLVLFAVTAQMSQGVNFSIVPFVSKRALGAVSGVVGAGGSFGAIVLQFAFFFKSKLLVYDGIRWMGVLIAAAAFALVPLIHFPMWGSMLRAPTPGADEMDYYLSEYSPEEIVQGFATPSMKFAEESRSQRGNRSTAGSSRSGSSVAYQMAQQQQQQAVPMPTAKEQPPQQDKPDAGSGSSSSEDAASSDPAKQADGAAAAAKP